MNTEDTNPVPTATMKHYLYDVPFPGVAFGIFNGKVRSFPADKPAPEASSPWEPPVAPEGKAVYFDGIGWITSLPWAEFQAALPAAVKEHFLLQVTHEMAALKETYPDSEVSTWDLQTREAKEYLATGKSAFITALAEGRAEDPEELAEKILAKADQYGTDLAALLVKLQLRSSAAVNLSKVSPADLERGIRILLANTQNT